MIKNLFFLAAALILEVSFTTLPIVFLTLFIIYIFQKKANVFFFAFLFGILLDIFSVRAIGQTGIFFLAFLFLVALYEKKFETETIPFAFAFSFLGSFIYLLFFNYTNVFLQALASSLFATLAFVTYKRIFLRRLITERNFLK